MRRFIERNWFFVTGMVCAVLIMIFWLFGVDTRETKIYGRDGHIYMKVEKDPHVNLIRSHQVWYEYKGEAVEDGLATAINYDRYCCVCNEYITKGGYITLGDEHFHEECYPKYCNVLRRILSE